MSDPQTGPQPGLSFELKREVQPDMSARHLGSGDVGVLATPAMIAMMEGASMRAVADQLGEGQTTVGYVVNIRHLAPTPIGAEVVATARLESVDGRKLKFRVEVREGDKLVGEGEHVRVIIDSESCLKQSNQ
jgi:fluoroacetyl-CoA thioesterase